MSLFFYLGLCVIFSALVASMAGGSGSKLDRALPASLIAIEVLLMLVAKGIIDCPGLSDGEAREVGCAIIAIAAFWDFIRRDDKAFPLLAFFASLTQLLVVFDIVNA